jgi:hypothetical protein
VLLSRASTLLAKWFSLTTFHCGFIINSINGITYLYALLSSLNFTAANIFLARDLFAANLDGSAEVGIEGMSVSAGLFK